MLCLFKICYRMGFWELLTPLFRWSPLDILGHQKLYQTDLHANTVPKTHPRDITVNKHTNGTWTRTIRRCISYIKWRIFRCYVGLPECTMISPFQEFLQEACARYINSEMSGLPQIKGKMVRSLCSRLKGKEGRYFARTKHVTDVWEQ